MMSGTGNDTGETPPLHTGKVDGETIVGVLYIGNTGEFYEFQDPDTHDKYALWVNPRNGEEMVYNNVLDMDVKKVMGGHIRAAVPVAKWREFREDYLNASEEQMDDWKESVTPEHPLRELALDSSG